MRESDSIVVPVLTTVYHNKMVYENGNLVKIEEESGKWEYNFTYENGLMQTFLNLYEGDSTAWGTITAYTADGNMQEILAHNNYTTTKWTLTWENGDAVKVVQDIIEPAELAETNEYTFSYDDKPCVYTGTPLGYSIPDSSGVKVARRMSKHHNQIEEGCSYTYDDNGLLISAVTESESVSYNYIEQTVE